MQHVAQRHSSGRPDTMSGHEPQRRKRGWGLMDSLGSTEKAGGRGLRGLLAWLQGKTRKGDKNRGENKENVQGAEGFPSEKNVPWKTRKQSGNRRKVKTKTTGRFLHEPVRVANRKENEAIQIIPNLILSVINVIKVLA